MSLFTWLGVIALIFVVFCGAVIWMLLNGEEKIDQFSRGHSMYKNNKLAQRGGSKLENQFMEESISGEMIHKHSPHRM